MSSIKRITSHFSIAALIATFMVAIPTEGQLPAAVAAPNDSVCELPGYGLEDYPYLVDSPQDFAEIPDCDDTGVYFLQRVDVEFGDSWPAITSFRGHFDGNGRVISGLLTNQPAVNDLGLFGEVSQGSSIRNVTITDSIVEGDNSVGILAATVSSGVTIENVKLFRVVARGSGEVGILAGLSSSGANNVSIFDGHAEADGNVGGLFSILFAQGGSGSELSEVLLSNISMKDVSVDHPAGNSNTRMGSLVGILISSENASVTIRNISISGTLDDEGSGTQTGILFGSHFNPEYDSLPVTVSNVVVDVEHEATNPSSGRPLSILGAAMDAISFDVSRVVVSVSSDQVDSVTSPTTRTAKVVELLGGANFGYGTTVEASEVYFDTDRHPVGDFTFTTGATAKTLAQLREPDLYSNWSLTSDINDLFQQPDSHTWFQESSNLPWLARAIKSSAGNATQYFLSAPSVLARAGEFGVFDFVGPSPEASAQVRLEIRATNAADAQLISLRPPEANLWSTVSVLQDGTVRFEGTLEEVESDLKRHILDPTHSATQVDLTIKLWFANYLVSTLLDESLTLLVQGCSLSGTGTELDPYLIQAEGDLSQIMACDDQGVVFEQTTDIVMQRPHVPIGHDEKSFEGIYDGGGFSITNLTIDNQFGSYLGLFGVVGDGAGTNSQTAIKNLTVSGSVTGFRNIGLLVGDVDDLKVSNVNLFGNVSGYTSVALLAGDAEDLKAVDVLARGTAMAEFSEVGLIVGDGYEDDIWLENIEIEGQVVGHEKVGGLAGALGDGNDTGLVRNVTARVDVIGVARGSASTSDIEEIGGLVGVSEWMRYFDIEVRGLALQGVTGRVLAHKDPANPDLDKERIGGLIGESYGDTIRDVDVIIDVISENPQSDDLNVGGLIGEAGHVEIDTGYYQGEVRGYENVGGVIGIINDDGSSYVANVQAIVDVHGVEDDIGGFAGFVGHGNDLDESTWIEDVFIAGSVSATSDAPIGGFIGDIDVSDNLSGSDDWEGRITILRSGSSADVSAPQSTEAGGFIGYLEVVSPTLIEDSYATGSVLAKYDVGGFIGEITSGTDADATVTIRRSFATGDVEATGDDDGESSAGGFVGWLEAPDNFPDSTIIDQAFSAGNVEGIKYVGGFIGELDGGLITNSYSEGNVLGDASVGGFVGIANDFAEMENSFTSGDAALRDTGDNTSDIGPFVGSFQFGSLSDVAFFPGNTSALDYPQVNDGDEIRLTSSTWSDASTYTTGWDIDESLDSGESVWIVCPEMNTSRMVLWFEAKEAQATCNGTTIPAPPSSLNTGGIPLDFDFFTDRGVFADVGYSVTYLDIIDGSEYPVDARVTVLDNQLIDSASCSGSTLFDPPNNLLEELDSRSSDPALNRWLELELRDICLDGAEEAFTELKFEFFIESNPVALEQIVLNITDVDHRQFVEVSNFDRYSLAEDSILSARVVNGVTRIEETQDLSTSTTGTSDDFDYIGSALTVGRAQFEFDSASEIVVKAGAYKDGDAYFDFDFSSGGEWVDARGTVQVQTIDNPVVEAAEVEAVTAAPYEGPVVFSVDPQSLSQSGGEVSITGRNLESVSRIQVAGVDLVLSEVSAELITARVPAGLALGLQDAELTSDFGKLMIADLIRVVSEEDLGFATWTSLKGDYVKVYAKNLVGVGKVQFMHNGQEIAWVRAVDQSDPKLRRANGFSYLVRSIDLLPGKNVFEVYVDGERVRRAAYTLR